jgi:hypothetical protein
MLQEKVDGVSMHNKVALDTLKNIKEFCKNFPTVYLPTHDPDSQKRFDNQELVFSSVHSQAG